VHKTAREAIIRALKSVPFAIPIPEEVAAKAVQDQDGDALDALVLLLGSWISQRLSMDKWEQQLTRINGCGAAVEGWFPV
jgi:predicted kinase